MYRLQLESRKMVETDMTNIVMNSEDDAKEKQGSIVVPIDDMDTVSSDSPSTVDELAMELATIQQSAKELQLSEAVTFLLLISK